MGANYRLLLNPDYKRNFLLYLVTISEFFYSIHQFFKCWSHLERFCPTIRHDFKSTVEKEARQIVKGSTPRK